MSKKKALLNPTSIDALDERYTSIQKHVTLFKGFSLPPEFGFWRFIRIDMEYRLCFRFPELMNKLTEFAERLAEDMTDEGVHKVHQLIQRNELDEEDEPDEEEREAEENRVTGLLLGRSSVFHQEIAYWLGRPNDSLPQIELVQVVLESLRQRMIQIMNEPTLPPDPFVPRYERLIAKLELKAPACNVLFSAFLLATTPGFHDCLNNMANGLEDDRPTISTRLMFFEVCTGLSAKEVAIACHEDGPLRQGELLDNNLKITDKLRDFLLGICELH